MRAPVPRVARAVLSVVAPRDQRAWLLADLDEEAALRAAADGMRAARAWATRQVLTSVIPLLAQRSQSVLSRTWRTRMTIWRGMTTDISIAVRRMAGAPVFTMICLLTLGLGIGGTTAVFTLIDQVLVASLPVTRPTELIRVGDSDDCCVNTGLQRSFSLFSYDLYRQFRDRTPEFSDLAAFQAQPVSVSVRSVPSTSPPESFVGELVSGNYFQTFGLRPALGRLLLPSDDRPDSPPVVVLSHRTWLQRFAGDPRIVGGIFAINGIPSEVIGVAPAGFYGAMLRPDSEEVWIPLSNEPRLQPQAQLVTVRGAHWLYAIGRLRRPDLDLRPIEARLTGVLQQWLRESPELPAEFAQQIPSQVVHLVSAASGVTSLRAAVAPSLRVLLAIAGSVLLIACANLANLLLARGMGRRTEMAVRAALGASRSRLVVGSIVESVLLACLGGALGLIVAYAGARVIVSQAFRGATYVPIHTAPSALVLAFTFGMSLVTGIAFGLVPAVLESGARAGDTLRGVGRVAGDRGASLRRSLVAIQVALSLGLVACAGLLGRSLINLQQQDFGFRPDSRVIARLGITLGTGGFDRLESIYQRLAPSLEQIPGVARAGFALYAPLEGNNWSSRITVEGHAASERLGASWNRVSPRFFETIGVPIVRGRMLTERDRDGQAVAVVNQTFAAKFFPSGDAIGRHFGMADSTGGGAQDYEIVGIVADARFQDARRPAFAMFFLPFLQPAPHLPASAQGADRRSNYAGRLALHLTQDVPNLDEQIRRAVASVDPALTVQRVVRLDEQVALNFNNDRLIAMLSATFGGMALLLACLGLYGVTAYNVERRTREIGIRIAVGASRGRVLKSVLRSALLHALVGIAAGIPLALLGGRLLQNQLFGVSGRDPWMLALAALILAACSAGAAFIPAWRAATTDPIRALRTD